MASKPRLILIAVAVILMLSMAAATVIERRYGRGCACGTVYGSWWFLMLWVVLVMPSLTFFFKKRLRQRHGLALLHLSLVIILLGASVTRLTSVNGRLRLHAGIPASYFTTDDGRVCNLPFSTELDSCSVVTSPATGAVMDYRACITVHTRSAHSSQSISMNNIGHASGYRLYISSFDADGRGVILLVSYDPYGTAITYTGFLFFLVGMVWSVFSRRSLMRHLYRIAMSPAVIILLLSPLFSHCPPCVAAPKSGSALTGCSPNILLGSAVPYGYVKADVFSVANIAETLYDTLRSEVWPAYACLALSLLLCVPRFRRHAPCLLSCVFPYVLFFLISLHVLLRWTVTGHAPVSDIPETLLLMSWLSSALSLVVRRRVPVLGLLCPVIASVCMSGSLLSDSVSHLSSLPPVLRSPLLSVHVVLVMVSYTLLSCITLLSVRSLLPGCLPDTLPRLTALSRLLLYPAVLFLASGIIAGAVWANISWGTYWSWDAKETWALLTLMAYLAPFHIRRLDGESSPRLYHIYVLVSFLVVIATYFGVSYLLPGMHSYA